MGWRAACNCGTLAARFDGGGNGDGRLACGVYATNNVGLIASSLRDSYVSKANVFLRKHRMKVDATPYGGGAPTILDYNDVIPARGWQPPPFPSDQAGILARKTLRALAGPNAEGRIKVIFCKIAKPCGEAPGTLGSPSDYGPYILISEDYDHPDGLTLVHELGHCAGLAHPDIEDEDDIMGYGKHRKTIYPTQLEAFRNSPFHFNI